MKREGAAKTMRLASLFADRMVLQRGRDNPVWGWDRPGQRVTLLVERGASALAEATTTSGPDGAFRVVCPELPAGGPYRLRVRGSGECLLESVLVGEVWLASGQSNMEWSVAVSAGAEQEIAEARWPQIRVFTASQHAAEEPQAWVPGRWQACDSPAVGDLTAVGYSFAREIHRALGVPVGVIAASWGGTRVEAWTSLDALRSVMDVDAERRALANAAVEAKYPPAALYHGMIAPLVSYGLRGALFYQGESNVENHADYRRRFTALIRDWRRAWGLGDFPFYFVQLASFVDTPAWAYLREAQAGALTEPSTGMVVTIDIGDPADIHPRNKREVGRRLALLALARTYGHRDLEWSGPLHDEVTIVGNQVTIRFLHGEGLRARGGGELCGFALAASDGAYRPARGHIAGEHVVLTSPGVLAPASVRYAWADHPDANLENGAGLPAGPFRTDHD